MCECAGRSTNKDAARVLDLLIDRSLASHEQGHPTLARAYACAGETLLRYVFLDRAASISKACSRKGRGTELGYELADRLCSTCIACIAVVLLLRGARRPVLVALASRITSVWNYENTVMRLCRRAFRRDRNT